MSSFRALLALPLLLLGLPLLGASCVASTADEGDDIATGDDPISASEVIARAEEWVHVKLHYCQAPNHQRDYDAACSKYCNRHDDPRWDPYRSDCSGLVSWAWKLPAPGRTTYGFAPFQNDITKSIPATDLEPGDAINNADHVMLFKHWDSRNHRATFIEEPGCSSATPYAHEVTSDVSVSGHSIYVSHNGMTFTAIRYNRVTNAPPPPAMSSDRIGVSTYGPGRLDLFARDEKGRLRHRYFANHDWSHWEDLGGDLESAPAAASWAAGRIDVFAQGAHSHLVHKWWDGSKWHAFEELGGTLTSAPAVISQEERSLDVFARDADDHLVHKYFRDQTGWSGWEDLGGDLASTPTAVSWAPGRIDVFARDHKDNVAHIYFEGAIHAWSDWGALHGPVSSGPVVTSWAEGRLDLFATGSQGELEHRWFTRADGWSSWRQLGGTLISPATGVSWGDHRIDVFARGGGDTLVHRYFNANGWSPWEHEGDMPR